jgi:putative DNA primase/helicase
MTIPDMPGAAVSRRLLTEWTANHDQGTGAGHWANGNQIPDDPGDDTQPVADEANDLLPPPSDPMAVARVILAELMTDGQHLIRRWRGQWMRYAGPHWVEDEDGAVRKWIYTRLEHARYEKWNPRTEQIDILPWNPNRAKVADLLDALAAIVLLPETTNPPTMLDSGLPAGQYVACANGLLDVRDQQLHPSTPCYFGMVAVPFDYDPSVGAPVEWLRFLRTLWPPANGAEAETEEITTLQEWIGYVLSGRTDLQKILLMVGPRRSGKGTIGRIVAALVGAGNVAGPTLASLTTNFGLQPLLGRSLAIVGDARVGKDGQNQVVERLLSISGEDMITVDRKHREAWSGKIPARFMQQKV